MLPLLEVFLVIILVEQILQLPIIRGTLYVPINHFHYQHLIGIEYNVLTPKQPYLKNGFIKIVCRMLTVFYSLRRC